MLGGEVAARARRPSPRRASCSIAPRRGERGAAIVGLIAGPVADAARSTRAIEDYLTYLRVERGLSPATIRAYRGDLARLRRGRAASPTTWADGPEAARRHLAERTRRGRPERPGPGAHVAPPPGGEHPRLLPVRLRRRPDRARRRRPHRPAAPAAPAARDADGRRGRGAARGGAGPPRPGAARAAVRRRAAGQRGARARSRGPVARRRLRPGDRQGRPRAARAGRRHRARLARPLDRRGPAACCSRCPTSRRSAAGRCSSATAAGGSPGSRRSRSSAARPRRAGLGERVSPAHPPPLVRDAPARGRRRPADRPGVARACEYLHDPALHAPHRRAGPGGLRPGPSAGLTGGAADRWPTRQASWPRAKQPLRTRAPALVRPRRERRRTRS